MYTIFYSVFFFFNETPAVKEKRLQVGFFRIIVVNTAQFYSTIRAHTTETQNYISYVGISNRCLPLKKKL